VLILDLMSLSFYIVKKKQYLSPNLQFLTSLQLSFSLIRQAAIQQVLNRDINLSAIPQRRYSVLVSESDSLKRCYSCQ
jgi:hypothetical protein